MITASCHCGNIKLISNQTPKSLTSCNCSICHRYGVVWAYFKQADVEISIHDEPPKAYFWGDKMINFMHCPNCGCVTHYAGRGEASVDGSSRIAINTRMSPKDQVEGIPVRHFDGADSWVYLD